MDLGLLEDIKFQADMGLLLAFMFLWNMVGAIVLLPALVGILTPRKALRCQIPKPVEGSGRFPSH